MKEYPDPHQHLHDYLDRVKPNAKLEQNVFERAILDAEEDYLQKAEATLEHNLQCILQEHKHEMNKARRSKNRFGLWFCPVITLFYGLVIWDSFSRGNIALAVLCSFLACLLLLMLILGALL
jgi:hypothetical protein